MTHPNETLIRDLLQRMSGKDYDGAPALLDEGICWSFMFNEGPASVPVVGREAVRDQVLKGSSGVFREGDPRIHIDTVIASDAMVMAETHGSGARLDGRPYVNRYAWAFELKNGKVTKVREYMDTLYIADFMTLPAG